MVYGVEMSSMARALARGFGGGRDMLWGWRQKHAGRRPEAPRKARLSVEVLEDRTVPARLFGATGGASPNGLLLSIDPATGGATVIAPILLGGVVPISITGMDFDPATGILYGTTAGAAAPRNLVTIDPQTG